ncbi:unnamed protein product, partial [Allacma fusca]
AFQRHQRSKVVCVSRLIFSQLYLYQSYHNGQNKEEIGHVRSSDEGSFRKERQK